MFFGPQELITIVHWYTRLTFLVFLSAITVGKLEEIRHNIFISIDSPAMQATKL